MTGFSPIAIVGRALVAPGVLSPEELWKSVVSGEDLISTVPGDRWGMRPSDVMCGPNDEDGTGFQDRTWSDRGGYVRGFEEIFDLDGFGIDSAEVATLDPVFQWTLHTARQALRDAGYDKKDPRRFGAVFGNLSFPSASMAAFTQAVSIESADGYGLGALIEGEINKPAAVNRFNSGLPALVLERALGLGQGAYALDAACASSLYAIKLACDQLHDGSSDLMLAGAVNCADDLCIHLGFAALQALSRTGQSRPFHQEADGLVPAEGCGFVALRRLEDAVLDGDTIHGIIRGVGLSNDGRGRGMLVPSSTGQERAIAGAFDVSGLAPTDISLLECHATGTQVGDATEIKATASVYRDCEALPIGSLKSNTGHLITAAGVIGLIKMTEAMRNETRPPTLHTEAPLEAIEDSPFRLLNEAEPWDRATTSDGVLRAGVSAFGFGGNNAHLIVEEPASSLALTELASPKQLDDPALLNGPIAIVGIGVIAASAVGQDSFDVAVRTQQVCLNSAGEGEMPDIALPLKGLRFPPNDLKNTLGQQLAMLQVTDEALANVESMGEFTGTTGIYVGMGTDIEAARYGIRWRLATAARKWAASKGLVDADSGRIEDWLAEARDGVGPALNSAGVLGTMPNIVANRLNSQYDMSGPSFSVSAEERSGLEAIDVASRALRCGEIDAAMVGAVDLACNPVHVVAANECLDEDRRTPGDAAVMLVLKRLDDAERDGDSVYALLPGSRFEDPAHPKRGTEQLDRPDFRMGVGEDLFSVTDLFGHAHAASALVHVAAAALSLHSRVKPGGSPLLGSNPGSGSGLVEGVGPRTVSVEVDAMDGIGRRSVLLAEASNHMAPPRTVGPRLYRYGGESVAALLQNVASGTELDLDGSPGEVAARAQLVIVANNGDQLAQRQAKAVLHIENGHPPGQGVHYRADPIDGEMAFVFTAAGAAYPGMGAELVKAMPDLLTPISNNFPLGEVAGWVYQSGSEPGPSDYLWGTSLLSQAHAQLTLGLLGLKPSAAIGYSSGESNSLYAFGIWSDMDSMRREIDASGMMERELGVDFAAVARSWGTESVDWAVWNVLAPLDEVRNTVDAMDRVHLAIINTENDVVISGDAEACQVAVDRLGRRRCLPMGYNLACHVPEVAAEFHQPWIDIHTRMVSPVEGIRHYSNGLAGSYVVGEDACAQAITAQAETTLDFPATIKAAYADGVRVFVEHGPAGACTNFISEILKGKDVLCVQLDRREGGVEQIFDAVAALTVAGIGVDVDALESRLPSFDYSLETSKSASTKEAISPLVEPKLMVPSHPGPIRLPPRLVSERTNSQEEGHSPQFDRFQSDLPQLMVPAPQLPPVGLVLELTTSGGATLLSGDALFVNGSPRGLSLPVETLSMPDSSSLSGAPVMSDDSDSKPELGPLPGSVVGPSGESGSGEGGSGEGGSAEGESMVTQQFSALAEIHQGFIRQQSEVHAQFLARRVQMDEMFASGSEPLTGAEPPVGASHTVSALHVPSPLGDQLETDAIADPASALLADEVVEPPITRRGSIVFDPTGPTWDKEQLRIHSSGKISELFGEMFEDQDKHDLQCRMPEPPLLLADRVTGIAAAPGILGQGTIWTETDVAVGDWYLNDGYMPAGFMIESGQADLMLISYMGIDLLNQGERVYRLLGCTLTYHGDLPSPGETLEYEIRVNGHAKHGDVRLFFFEYDCIVNGERRLTVRDGQAGFFSYEELNDALGILWTPEQGRNDLSDEARLDAPIVACTKSSFGAADLAAFSEGRLFDCFGPGYEWAETHTRSPRVQAGGHLFIDEISEYDPSGGPWGRGFLRCETAVKPDDWFFEGHFKNDPCMPGNFMVEACIEALSFYIAAAGFTLKRDGWRFQPLPEQAFDLKCRGEINPQTTHVSYEVHVEELWDGPNPSVICDVVGFVDGEAAFHAHRIGVELVPGWPLTTMPELAARDSDKSLPPVAIDSQGFPFDWKAMISCAWGRPSEAFGSMYEVFDGARQSPRLPGEPYHFISRITKIEGDLDVCQAGMKIECEYDVPDNVWYFDENGAETMPFAVLLEAALQPCGWVASAVGSVTKLDEDLMFRNLDGTGTVLAELSRRSGTLRTEVEITNVSVAGGMIIESFEVKCYLGQTMVYEMDTVFGFFPPEAFDNQAGLPIKEEHRLQLETAAINQVDLTSAPERFCSGSVRLADPMLLMIDRATHIAGAGEAGLGILRGEKDVDVSEWFFKAHFFQDPVQPGSLGIEALIQLLQFYMLDTGMADELPEGSYFEPLKVGAPLTWKYRGQVTPKNSLISSTMEISEVGLDDTGPYVIGSGSLWVDGLRIYEAKNMGMRIVSKTSSEPEVTPGSVVLRPGSDLSARLREFWNPFLGTSEGWVGEDVVLGLVDQYVNRVVLPSQLTLERLRDRPAIYVANHQVQIESLIVTNLIPALTGVAMTTMANAKHQERWIGQLIEVLESFPGFKSFDQIVYFEQDKPETMFEIVEKVKSEMAQESPLRGKRSFFVHTDGTRSQSCREETIRCSSVFLDMALELNVPIVPVCFTGGLPVEPIVGKAEFPVGHGKQDYWIGEPIEPDELRAMTLRDRVDRVVSAINELGVSPSEDVPLPVDTAFASKVEQWERNAGVHEVFAAIWQILQGSSEVVADTEKLRRAMATGQQLDGWLGNLAALFGARDQPMVNFAAKIEPSTTSISVGRDSHPHLADHAIDGDPVVPVVYVAEWFLRAAADYTDTNAHGLAAMVSSGGNEALVVDGIKNLQVFKGLALDGFGSGDNLELDLSVEIEESVDADKAELVLGLTLREAGSQRPSYRCLAILTKAGQAVSETGPDGLALAAGGSASAVSRGVEQGQHDGPAGGGYYGGVLFHGPAFQVVEPDSVVPIDGGLVAAVSGVLGKGWVSEQWICDPAALDGLLQLALLWTETQLGGGSLPTSIGSVRVFGAPSVGTYRAVLTGRAATNHKVVCDLFLVDSKGLIAAELLGVETHLLPG